MGNKLKHKKAKTHKEMVAGWMKDPEFKAHSPSLSTLRKYAETVGCRLEVHIIPLTGT